MIGQRIGIDIDGVLANFYSAYESLTIEVSGKDLFGPNRYPAVVPPTWNWPEFYGYDAATMKECWRRIKASDSFWYGLGALPDAEAARLVHASGADVYYITDRVGVNAKAQTEAWLHRHGFPAATVLISGHKGLCAKALRLDVYVDDKGENIQDVDATAPETRGYLVDRAYNVNHAVARRVVSLAEAMAQ